MDLGAAEQAEILTGGVYTDTGVRRATLVEPETSVIDDIEGRLESCRDSVSASLGMKLGAREGAGFIRYPAGGFYKAHSDRGADPHWQAAARRAAALVLFLNASRDVDPDGDFDGGLLRLYTPGGIVEVRPQTGLLIAFPADLLHEVTEVRRGTRDTIVDWFYDG